MKIPAEYRSTLSMTRSIALGWSGVALAIGLQNYLALQLDGRPVSMIDAMLWHLPILGVWAVATPFIFLSTRRFPVIGPDWRKHLLGHVVLGIAFVVAINAASPILYPAAFPELTYDKWADSTVRNVTQWLPLALLVYLGIAAIGHLVYRFDREPGRAEPDHPTERESFASYPDRITIRGLNRSFVIPTHSIEWIESSGDHVLYHVGDRTRKERNRLKNVECCLDPRTFARVHRTAIVQVAFIREVHPLRHGDFLLLMEDGARIRLARSRRKALEFALGRPI